MSAQKITFSQQPPLVTDEGKSILVCFGMEEKEETYETVNAKGKTTEAKRTVWEGYAVRADQPISRDKVIDAIVTAAYPQDVMQAVVNNHLLDEADDEDYKEHLAEWTAMQQWRKQAKQVAKEVMEALVVK